ncbi:type II toxin-antitoxin system death-on-curing family toxin [bacterium]|nr:type II toxin-antitoxin system death-on-curing family toxin [bacterium]
MRFWNSICQSINQFGGANGIRDQGAFQSAVSAPLNTYYYSNQDVDFQLLVELAATYWFHLSQNHPFIDGNKRTAFAASLVFLKINGLEFDCPEDTATQIGLGVAGGKIGKQELIDVIATFIRSQSPS